jgi:PBP1b-binding outer membrane lipoprotein LpoB
VRGSEKEELDEYAMSLRLDRKDINRLYDKNIDKMMNSSIISQWERQAAQGTAPVVAIFPMRNETNQNVELDAVLSKFETDLVNQTPVDVVSHENQSELIAEIKRQQSDAYNPRRLAPYGKQLGAQFFVTGKLYGVREQVRGEKRQQYFMFIQVIDVATGAIKFQNEAGVTKGLVK